VLAGPEGLGIRLGIERSIGAFLDAIERGERPAGGAAEVWRRLGEAELASRGGVPTDVVIGLAEAIFVFTDGLDRRRRGLRLHAVR
jgi:hypothetical protein